MHTISIIFATFLGIVFSDYDYSYYAINGGERGECTFGGSISNTNSDLCKTKALYRKDLTQGADLTWEILTEVCPELVQAGCADPSWSNGDEHNMTRDLEWPSSCGSCPACPCNNGEPDTYYINNYTTIDTSSGFQVSQCRVCECEEFRTYYNDDIDDWVSVYARDCTGSSSFFGDYRTFNSPDELNDLQCPYTTPEPTPQPTDAPTEEVCDDGYGNYYAIGQYFFAYDDGNCEQYCKCNSSAGLECEQGWKNITSREDMRVEFLNDCGSYLEDAFNDTSRWAKNEDYTIYCSASSIYPNSAFAQCPINKCGDYNAGESWNTTSWYFGSYDEETMTTTTEYYNCETCTCRSDISGWNNTDNEVLCSTTDYYVSDISECGEQSGPTSGAMNCSFDDNYNNEIDDTDDVTVCSTPDQYCSWNKGDLPAGFDPDTVCIKNDLSSTFDNDPYWGCEDDTMCIAAFGYEKLNESETGFCSYNEVSLTAKEFDCIDYVWKSESYTINYNFMCCGKAAGDLCNQQMPSETALGDDNKCESKAAISSYLKAVYECPYGDRGVTNTDYVKELKCGRSLPDTNDIEGRVCDLIENRWKWDTTCTCQEYQALEKAFGNSEYEDSLRTQLQLSFDSSYASLEANLEEWNEEYECGKVFECDIYDSSVNKIKLSFLSVIFIFFINYYL